MENGLHKVIVLGYSNSFAKHLQKRICQLKLWVKVCEGINLGRSACDRGSGAGVDAV